MDICLDEMYLEERYQSLKSKRVKKVTNRVKNYLVNPSNIILIFFAILLSILVLLPLFYLVLNTFIVHDGEERLFGEIGSVTAQHWSYVLFRSKNEYSLKLFWKPLWNSILMSLVSCLFAIVIGGGTAWFVTRSDIPFKKFISTIFILPYIMPSWSIAMYWENMFSSIDNNANRIGFISGLFNIGIPNSVCYGFWPCAICLGVHYAPFAYILIGGILRNMDANLEEAATILNTSRFRILMRITLPIVAPSILSTILLVFSSSISSYTVPMFLGQRGDFNTISLQMKSFLNVPQSYGRGYVVATILLIFSVIILLINQKMTTGRKQFTTITGKSGQVSYVKLGKAKYFILTFLLLYILFFSIAPIISFFIESITESGAGGTKVFTSYYWTTTEETSPYIHGSVGIFHNVTIWKGLGNSLLLSLLVSFFAGTFGILIGYAVSKNRRGILSNYVSAVSFFPYLIPAMSLSAVYLSVSVTKGLTFLYHSLFLLVIVGTIKFMPFATKSDTSAMLQVSGEIEESAIIQNIGWGKRMTRIMFPIQKSSFISGYLLPFISCMRELSLFVLLSDADLILTSVLQNYQTYDVTQMANGINLIIIVFVLAVNFLTNKLTGASVDKGVGGAK